MTRSAEAPARASSTALARRSSASHLSQRKRQATPATPRTSRQAGSFQRDGTLTARELSGTVEAAQ